MPRGLESLGAEAKDQLELVLAKLVCSREVSLTDAQHEMATDWVRAYQRYVPTHRAPT